VVIRLRLRSGTESDGHDGADKGQNHLGLYLNDVFREEEDGGTDLAGYGDGVLGVLRGVLVVGGVGDERRVDGTGLDRVEQINEEDASLERGVLERVHLGVLAVALDGVVGPLDDVLVADLATLLGAEPLEDGDDMETHQLPHNGQGQGLIAVIDISATNADKGEFEGVLLAEIYSVVAVLNLLELVQRLLGVDLGPINGSWVNLVHDLQDDQTVTQVSEQVVHEGIDAERVHPQGKGTRLAGSLGSKEPFLELGLFGFGEGLEAGVGVEQVGDEGQVELGVAGNNVAGLEELAAAELVSVLEHPLFTDLRDGLVILRVMDKVHPGSVDWTKVNTKEPLNKFKKVENCNYAVDVGKKDPFKFSLVGIGGTDLYDGNKTLTLAVVWQLMRFHVVSILKGLSAKQGGQVSDQDIIKWANETVKSHGKHSKMDSFQDSSLKTGIFFIDLLDAVKPGTIDTTLVTDGSNDKDATQNAKYAISIARKIGATIFLLPEDIVEVKPKMILTFVGSIMAVALGATPQA